MGDSGRNWDGELVMNLININCSVIYKNFKEQSFFLKTRILIENQLRREFQFYWDQVPQLICSLFTGGCYFKKNRGRPIEKGTSGLYTHVHLYPMYMPHIYMEWEGREKIIIFKIIYTHWLVCSKTK